jgi:hypothetical protein
MYSLKRTKARRQTGRHALAAYLEVRASFAKREFGDFLHLFAARERAPRLRRSNFRHAASL